MHYRKAHLLTDLVALDCEIHEELSMDVGLLCIVGGGDLAKYQCNTPQPQESEVILRPFYQTGGWIQ